MDPDASKSSALNYLLQEVSKLAPPVHNASSTMEGRAGPSRPSGRLCQHSLPCVSPHKRIRTAMERRGEYCSPWRVLSLINLQCERLLYPGDVEERDPTLASCGVKLGHSADGSARMGAAGADQGVEGDGLCVECTLRQPLICERRAIGSCVSPGQTVEGVDDACKPQCFDQKPPPRSPGEKRVFDSQPAEEDGPLCSQPAQRNDSRVKFRCLGSEEQPEHVDFSTKPDVYSLPFPENDVSPEHIPDASLLLTFSGSVSLSRPPFTLDHNANIVVAAETPCGSESPLSGSDSLPFSAVEGCQVLSEPLDQIQSKAECEHLAEEEESPPVAPLTSSSDHEQSSFSSSTTVKSEPGLAEEEEEGEEEKEGEGGGEEEEEEEEEKKSVPPFNHQTSSKSTWRTKTPRKQANPSRSADVQDPHFQGVTFRMDTELDDGKEQCRLLITSKYSKELSKGVRKPKMRLRTSHKSIKTCCSDEEGDPANSVSRGKVCASCCTRKTPMWRDAEDGTPLCNACGIRYKKYRVRCVNCWHIPRKEGNSNSCCLKCGNFAQLTSTQRKHTT